MRSLQLIKAISALSIISAAVASGVRGARTAGHTLEARGKLNFNNGDKGYLEIVYNVTGGNPDPQLRVGNVGDARPPSPYVEYGSFLDVSHYKLRVELVATTDTTKPIAFKSLSKDSLGRFVSTKAASSPSRLRLSSRKGALPAFKIDQSTGELRLSAHPKYQTALVWTGAQQGYIEFWHRDAVLPSDTKPAILRFRRAAIPPPHKDGDIGGLTCYGGGIFITDGSPFASYGSYTDQTGIPLKLRLTVQPGKGVNSPVALVSQSDETLGSSVGLVTYPDATAAGIQAVLGASTAIQYLWKVDRVTNEITWVGGGGSRKFATITANNDFEGLINVFTGTSTVQQKVCKLFFV